MRRLLPAALIAVGIIVALMVLAGRSEFPYTYDEMSTADFACDIERDGDVLSGQALSSPSYDRNAKESCLARKLPELSTEQLVNFSITLEKARASETE